MPDIKTDALETVLTRFKVSQACAADEAADIAIINAALAELTALRARVERGEADRVAYLEAALRKIAKREGRFSRDHLTHASNTIEDMATVAEHALNGTWENEEEPSHA